MNLTPDQINQLQSLGIKQPKPAKKSFPVLPLLSISGITLISFGSLILLKSKKTNIPISPSTIPSSLQNKNMPSPTQVPKSIQHYLLASQQYFSQALQLQNTKTNSNTTDNDQIISLLNQSILSATTAIQNYPQDHRGYYQRASIYQSLADSQPQFLNSAINDLQNAQKHNQNNPQITRNLASLFAEKGDTQNTINYLQQTVILEPTKAQNFYDLAKIQQQTGLLPQALTTYNQLLPLVTDPAQIDTIKSEVSSLENLTKQNAKTPAIDIPSPEGNQGISLPDSPSLIKANSNTTGLIIAGPETTKDIKVDSLTDSNSFSDTATLTAGQKQLTLKNSNLTPTSQVYLTTIKGGKNQTLRLISKSSDSFIIGLDSPITEDLDFKWWIIN